MSSTNTDILAFVEDPGAANFVAPVIPELASAGCKLKLLATASGMDQLGRMGIVADLLDPTAEAASVLRRCNPRLVLIGTSENPDTMGLKLVLEARHREIASIGVVDGPANAEWRFRGRGGSALACSPDWILVADDDTRAAFVSLGHPHEKVLAVGHPHYDHVWERRSQMESAGRQAIRDRVMPASGMRQVVTFIAEVSEGLNPPQFMRAPDYTLAGRGVSSRRTDIVLEEVLDALALVLPRPYLVLRLHPQNALDDFADYRQEIDFISQTEDALEIAFASDLVVGMTSHLLLEAVILGRPTLAVVPRALEKAWLSTISAGHTACATSRSSLRAILTGLCDGRGIRTYADTTDGVFARGAAKRVSRILANLAAGTQESRDGTRQGSA